MSDKFELKGRVALITGGGRGIGAAICRELAGAGAAVIVADVEGRACKSTSKDIEKAGGVSVFRELDVTDFDSVQKALNEVAEEFGGLHVLVNNAGISDDQFVGRMKPGQWQRVIDTNLGGCFNTCRAASRIMIKQRQGRIINISSIVAGIGRAGQANYAASKAGIEGLTRSLALELAHRGITVNAIAPGYIDTEMTKSLPEKMRKEILGRVPLQRGGKPGEVASLVRFLAGPDAAYITGQTIHINGGLYLG